MRIILLFLFLSSIQIGISQDSVAFPTKKIYHALRLNGYTTSYGYGGSELDYQLSVSLGARTRLIGQIGYFYLSVPTRPKKESEFPNLRYQYVAITAGVQRKFAGKQRSYYELNVGIPVLGMKIPDLLQMAFGQITDRLIMAMEEKETI